MTMDADVDRLIRRFVAARLTREEAQFEEVVARLDDEVGASVPLLTTDTELRRAQNASTRGQIRDFLAWLVADPTEPVAAPEAIEFARILARRGLDLEMLLRVYRFGQQATLNYTVEALARMTADPELQQRGTVALFGRALDWLNVSLETLITVYTDERESWLRGAIARRADMVETILHGDPFDVEGASRVLGHNLRACHTALELWSEEDGERSESAGRLDAVAGRLANAIRAPRPLVVPMGPRAVSAWLATARPPEVRRLATTRAERAAGAIRIAVGIPAAGPAGFVSSHRQAVEARRVAARIRLRPVVRYAEVELVSLVSQSLPAAREFVARQLHGLAANDDASARIRETLQLYLAVGVGEAADRLGVHRNTVRYRVAQAETLLGHVIDERRLELELALHCVALDATLLEPRSAGRRGGVRP